MSGSTAIETDEREEEERWIDSESLDDEPIAPRPRGRLLRPLPLALLAVTIAAAGFLGGVLAQKGSEGSAGAGAGGFPALAEAKGGAPGGLAGGGEAGGSESTAATGTVTSVEGHTIYVKEADGTVVAVKAGAGSSVTRDSSVSAKKVHPGDTVVVETMTHSNGQLWPGRTIEELKKLRTDWPGRGPMSLTGPIMSWIFSVNLRVSRSNSPRESLVGSQLIPPLAPP